MKRLFVAFLLLGLASVTIPQLRARVDPVLEPFRERLGQALEGPMSPVLNPYRRMKTRSQMGEIVGELMRDRNRGLPAPQPDDFDEFLIREQIGLEGRDPWGAPYLLRQAPDSLFVVSAGPDLEYDSEDDIVISMRYEDRSDRRRRRPGR